MTIAHLLWIGIVAFVACSLMASWALARWFRYLRDGQ